MENQTDIITYMINSFIMNIYIYYSFTKILNIKFNNAKNMFIILVINIAITILETYAKIYVDSVISLVIKCIVYGFVLGILNKNKIGCSIVITIISYAICLILFVISVTVEYILYNVLRIENYYINLCVILIIQFVLLYGFFKIKRFRKGFTFLYKKLDNDFIDVLIINISIAIFIGYSLLSINILKEVDDITRNVLIAFIILGITMIFIIQKTLKMYYKQKLLEDTMKEYEKEIKEKDEKIKQLSDEKFKVSKITHEFYNRQKALELLVKETSNMKNEISEEMISQNVLEQIKSLTEEYSENFEKTKNLSKLEKTEIPEIDNMFRYMQTECEKNDIEFKLKIIGNIYPLINNIIPKNRLETLIGDHLRDAINAIKYSKRENKEILAILGIKNNKYELSIYDTGIEFEISTLLKLGKEAVTTHKSDGGSGIGFLTTFETMEQTKASLIINEQLPESHYTKSVTIRFDDKNEYRICSYRIDKIKKCMNGENIVLEKKQ